MKERAAALLLFLPLCACVSTAAHVVTAPVRVAGWTVDKLTTSQAEADRNRGRRERKAEAKERRAERKQARLERERDRAAAPQP